MSNLKISRIEVHEFGFDLNDMAKDYIGFNLVYQKGSVHRSASYAMKVFTDEGVTGAMKIAHAAELMQYAG